MKYSEKIDDRSGTVPVFTTSHLCLLFKLQIPNTWDSVTAGGIPAGDCLSTFTYMQLRVTTDGTKHDACILLCVRNKDCKFQVFKESLLYTLHCFKFYQECSGRCE